MHAHGKKPEKSGLTEEEAAALLLILDHLIPASPDGRCPSASEIGFPASMMAGGWTVWVQEGLLRILKESLSQCQCSFLELSPTDRASLIDRLLRKMFPFFNRLGHKLIECYYHDDRVLKAIGCSIHPPFPEGFRVPDGDWPELLEPVFMREQLYRDV
jgi:hypothetical protein